MRLGCGGVVDQGLARDERDVDGRLFFPLSLEGVRVCVCVWVCVC